MARVGIALFLAGGAVLIQTHPFKSSENLPPHAAPPVVAREDSGSKPPVDRPATPPAATVSEVQVDAGVVEPPKEVPSGPAPPGDGGVAPPVDFKHKRKRPQPAAEEGALELKVKPGAMLYLDGWQVGRVRDGPIPLSPGEHSVRLVNRELRKDVTRQFTIAAGKTLRLEINLFEEKSR